MTRRGFLGALAAAVMGLEKFVAPGLKPATVVKPREIQAVRYITALADGTPINRMDVLYGFGTVRPEMMWKEIDAGREADAEFLSGDRWDS